MNYSFRKKNKIVKYIVIHYTGMNNIGSAFYRLNHINSSVSAHYLITRSGKNFNLICPKFKAWHAGISEWKNDKNLNEISIGIELENKGHEFGYQEYTNKQYRALNILIKFLTNTYRIDHRNILFHSDISPNRKKDPGEKFDIKKLKIQRFKIKKIKSKNLSIRDMFIIYGFSKNYINQFFPECVMAVKRTMRYKTINPIINKSFQKNFYNLLFL